ncbi:hypothetical protein THASP1DRAFT_29334 [Thamnocephalis sphaerospora]|uniref:F-box domain-containing protein n=1 Tax=Thamnocephalis sphaerospora TaxID=78915 RepID=A0A4P9XTJ5_9FUNG|nr:hypothetical protein THASP1DRAFT_29334 [Thamnocephalis sphaerospora]|eukprot:RKP08871.1 hypothetical protein THASP1DRAFT_29334 [Thamnocephalis sphaerospora]
MERTAAVEAALASAGHRAGSLARLPPELGFRVLWYGGPRAALQLAATCRSYRAHIVADRLLWRQFFEVTFDCSDDGWLRWYVATGQTDDAMSMPRRLDWYRAFIARLATERCWRNGENTCGTLSTCITNGIDGNSSRNIGHSADQWQVYDRSRPWITVWWQSVHSQESASEGGTPNEPTETRLAIRYSGSRQAHTRQLYVAGTLMCMCITETHLVVFMRASNSKEQHAYAWGHIESTAIAEQPASIMLVEWSPSVDALGPWLLTLASTTRTGALQPTLIYLNDGQHHELLHVPGAYVARHLQYVRHPTTTDGAEYVSVVGLFLHTLEGRTLTWRLVEVGAATTHTTATRAADGKEEALLVSSGSIRLSGGLRPPLRVRSTRLDDTRVLLHGADMRGPADFLAVLDLGAGANHQSAAKCSDGSTVRLLWEREVAYVKVLPIAARSLLLACLPSSRQTVPGVDRTSLPTAINRLAMPVSRQAAARGHFNLSARTARITVHLLCSATGTLLREYKVPEWHGLYPVIGSLVLLKASSSGECLLMDGRTGTQIRKLPRSQNAWCVNALSYHYVDSKTQHCCWLEHQSKDPYG